MFKALVLKLAINFNFLIRKSFQFDVGDLDIFKNVRQGKFIAVVYTLRTY